MRQTDVAAMHCWSVNQTMADTEFEEFRHYFEKSRQHYKAPAQNIYSLVQDIVLDEDSPTSPKSDLDNEVANSSTREAVVEDIMEAGTNTGHGGTWRGSNPEPPSIGSSHTSSVGSQAHRPERRRRRLPEIPKNKKSSVMALAHQTSIASHPTSLAAELGQACDQGQGLQFAIGGHARPLLVLKCSHSYLRDEDSSPDSEHFQSSEIDSGHSTAHSPSPPPPHSFSPVSTTSSGDNVGGGVPFNQLEMLEATHRGLHKFIPRHHDEIDVEIGDPIYVQKEAEDLWCEGVNLRSGRQGIFPSAYAVDMDYSDFDPSTPKVKRERYLLGYLGSVETKCHKGTSVLCQAVRKMTASSSSPKPHSCILEVTDQGLRMVDKRPRPNKKETPCLDYFYSLKNVSFCAFHPRDHRYMGFITKHPQLQRFACHVFLGQESTRPVAEAIGRAFQRFYTKYIETAFPIEDIYIE